MDLSDDAARQASQLMSAPAWEKWYKKRLEDEFKNHLNILARGKSAEDDIHRGWVQALNWAVNLPQIEIDEYNQAKAQMETAEALESEAAAVAERGFRSPFIQGAEKEH